jgi:hypothetical protein
MFGNDKRWPSAVLAGGLAALVGMGGMDMGAKTPSSGPRQMPGGR